MHEKLQEIIDHTVEKFGLSNYHLKRHHIFREQDSFSKSSYLLSMEWFPNDLEETDEGFNPAGTAIIEFDIHRKRLRRIAFVQEVTYADAILTTFDMEETIEWVEEETGLEFGRQFKLIHDENGELYFQAAVDNVAVYPSGSIRMQFNDEDQLVLFSIDGDFPDETQINWEPFSLTPMITDPIASEQCKLLEVPVEDEEKWLPVYGATTIFVTNDGERQLTFSEVEANHSLVKKDIILEWDKPLKEPFKPLEIDLSLEVSLEEALANEPHPDTKPLTEQDQVQAVESIGHFLQREFPNDSGQWKLTGIWREHGYIFAELKSPLSDPRVIERKMNIIMDREAYQVLNFNDNNVVLDMLKNFSDAEDAVLSPEAAFDKLRGYIDVNPVYVLDKAKGKYILCGKIDCSYGVDAVTGEVISLDEL